MATGGPSRREPAGFEAASGLLVHGLMRASTAVTPLVLMLPGDPLCRSPLGTEEPREESDAAMRVGPGPGMRDGGQTLHYRECLPLP